MQPAFSNTPSILRLTQLELFDIPFAIGPNGTYEYCTVFVLVLELVSKNNISCLRVDAKIHTRKMLDSNNVFYKMHRFKICLNNNSVSFDTKNTKDQVELINTKYRVKYR